MQTQYRATGRRKTSIAQVRLLAGSGNFTINGRDINDYFDYETLREVSKSPLELTDTLASFDVIVKVKDLLVKLAQLDMVLPEHF